MTGTSATRQSFERMLSVVPALTEISPLAHFQADLPARTLFHAGPPLRDNAAVPKPLQNAIAAAGVIEGWGRTPEDSLSLLDTGQIQLAPAQDFGIVTPLAFVVGPSTVCLKVADLEQPATYKLAPLNDGPPPDAIRFGLCRPEGLAVVRSLIDGIGADLASVLNEPVPLLPMMRVALAQGDELHGRVSAMQTQIRQVFDDRVSTGTAAYLDSAGQFALNVVMAAAALMIGAGNNISGSRMVTASGDNGQDFGYKVANTPTKWLVRPATQPIGPRMPGHETAVPLPAIGDSAVIDALGLGAACLRFCPEIGTVLQSTIENGDLPDAFLDDRAHLPFIGPHPGLGNDEVRVGLDLDQSRTCLSINLGMVECKGEHGLIGRGIAPWPTD